MGVASFLFNNNPMHFLFAPLQINMEPTKRPFVEESPFGARRFVREYPQAGAGRGQGLYLPAGWWHAVVGSQETEGWVTQPNPAYQKVRFPRVAWGFLCNSVVAIPQAHMGLADTPICLPCIDKFMHESVGGLSQYL